MKQIIISLFSFVLFVLFSIPAIAHFGMVIPSDSMVMQEDSRNLLLHLSFSHPFEMIGLDLVKPNGFADTPKPFGFTRSIPIISNG